MTSSALKFARAWPLFVGRRRGYRVLDRLVSALGGRSMRGEQWIAHRGIEILYDLDQYHERVMAYELTGEEGYGFVRELLRAGDCFVDAGANVGLYSATAADAVGPEGRVFSIEANPALAARLRRAVDRNRERAPHWTIIDRALSDADGGSIPFHLSEFHRFSSLVPLAATEKPSETIHVATTRLDNLASDFGKVRLMKIDIEGAETLAFRGGDAWLSSADGPDFIIAECNQRMLARSGSSAEEMIATIRRHRYVPHEMYWRTRRRPGARPMGPLPGSDVHIDLLFVHERAKL